MPPRTDRYALIPGPVSRVLRGRGVPASARNAALALSTIIGMRGRCVIGQSELAELMGVSLATAKRGLRALRQLNLIFTDAVGRENRYRWNLEPDFVQGQLLYAPYRIDRAFSENNPSGPLPDAPPVAPEDAGRMDRNGSEDDAERTDSSCVEDTTGVNIDPGRDSGPGSILSLTGVNIDPDGPSRKDARAFKQTNNHLETTPPNPPPSPSDEIATASPGDGGGGGVLWMISDEDRELAQDFAAHFRRSFEDVGFDHPEASLPGFALSIPMTAGSSFASRLVTAHALARVVAALPGKTTFSVQRRMLAVLVKTPDCITAERRQAAISFIRAWRRKRHGASTGGESAERFDAPPPRRLEPEVVPKESDPYAVVEGRLRCGGDACGFTVNRVTRASVDDLSRFDSLPSFLRRIYACPKCGRTLEYVKDDFSVGAKASGQ